MSSSSVSGGGRPTSHPHHSTSPISIHSAAKGIFNFTRIISFQDVCEGSVHRFPQHFWGLRAASHPAVCPGCSMWTAQQGGWGGETRIWLAVRAAGTDADVLFTPFPRSEEQRAGGCQQISGTKQLPCTAAQPIGGLKQTGYHFAEWSISILMECSARASAVEPKEGRYQDSHLSLLRILFGDSC